MDKNNLTLGFIVIVVIFVLYHLATINRSRYEQYLFGYWVGDDVFCDDAGITSLSMFIGEPSRGWTSTQREAYILIQMKNGDIITEGMTITYGEGWAGPCLGTYSVRATVEFDEVPLWDDLSCNVTISVNPINGTLRIYDGDKLYAKLYKEHNISGAF